MQTPFLKHKETDIQQQKELDDEIIPQSQFTSVTKFSKYSALLLFILLPFIGGWVGYTYAPGKVVEIEKFVEVVKIDGTDSKVEDINQADADMMSSSYRSLGGLYFKNINDGFIYFSKTGAPTVADYMLITQADPDTFEVYKDNLPYARDKNSVYFITSDDYFAAYPVYALKTINDADPETFKVNLVDDFPIPQGNGFQSLLTKDKNNVYYQDKVFENADPDTFVITQYISINYDTNYVFLWREIIPNADPQTYKVVFDTSAAGKGVVFGRDKKQCFKDYSLFDCDLMPTNWDEAYALSKP